MAKGVPDPRNTPSGFNLQLALELGSEVMAALITERFNWKWNRAVATPFNTNCWQQDYPLPASALPDGLIAWGEDCDIIQINSSLVPKPLNWDGAITWRRALTRTSLSRWRPTQICWMYNQDLTFGAWPGPETVLYPLLGATAPQGTNPLLNFVDANGNLLVLSEFGTTGASEPSAAAEALEGTLVTDGTAQWEVVDPTSQGFRLDWLPPSGQTFQIVPIYQLAPPRFAKLGQTLAPIPDSFSRYFFEGMEVAMRRATPDPAQKQSIQEALALWAASIPTMKQQGDQEQNSYGLVPATCAVETRWGWGGPITADSPYGNQ